MTSAAVLGVTRPPFLILTPVCVLLGLAAVNAAGLPIDWTAGVVAFIGALAAHVSVNALNEYGDFRSGLDFLTRRTPFSGGSGTLVENPQLVGLARVIGLAALALAAASGIYLLWCAGWALLPLGLVGLALVYFYTGPINRNSYLCLVAPGLGFGPLMVVGTAYAATGSYSVPAVVSSLVPFFLVSNLLLLNQFPDVEADRRIGRENLPISAGLAVSLRVYGLFVVLTYASLITGWIAGVLPPSVLSALVTAPVAVYVYAGVAATIDRDGNGDPAPLVPFLGINVALTLITPVLVAVGLAFVS